MTSGHHLPSTGETQPFLNAKVETFPYSYSGKSLFVRYLLLILIIAQIPLCLSFKERRDNPATAVLTITGNCCEPYPQGAMILGRKFRVVSKQAVSSDFFRNVSFVSYLSSARFPLGKKNQ